MQVAVTRIDSSLPLPKHETKGSVGIDLLARQEIEILPASIALIPANVIIQVPAGYMLMLASRSSTPRKKGLLFPHGIGIVDQDYCGPDDEILVQVYNFSEQKVSISRGEKIAQAVLVKIETIDFQETDNLATNSRGGFGSTDK